MTDGARSGRLATSIVVHANPVSNASESSNGRDLAGPNANATNHATTTTAKNRRRSATRCTRGNCTKAIVAATPAAIMATPADCNSVGSAMTTA